MGLDEVEVKAKTGYSKMVVVVVSVVVAFVVTWKSVTDLTTLCACCRHSV